VSAQLTAEQRRAMEMLQRRREQYPDEAWDGATTSDATWPDPLLRGARVEWPAFINWRTAQTLERRGLLTYEYIGPDEGATLTLTTAGLAWPERAGATS
jgi:hypothetical protein